MTLLFTTRKVDKNDERAGFVSGWLLEFSQNLTKLIVICQEKGDISNLPANVEVFSLGKEKGYGKFKQFLNFQKIIYKILLADKNRNLSAEAIRGSLKSEGGLIGVFSHMVPHFAIIAGPWCKIYHKKLIQWYVHKTVSPQLKIANFFVDEYVTTNAESFHLKTKKPIHYFGHGINIKRFAPIFNFQFSISNKKQFVILSVSRISPSKNIDLIIKSIEKILQTKPELQNKIQLQIVGAPGLKEQQVYHDSLINYVEENNLKNAIYFLGPLPPEKVLAYYQNCDLFINLSDTGSVDKAVLEAMAMEKIVLTSNVAFKNILPTQLFLANKNPEYLADKILEIYNLDENTKQTLQKKLRQEVAVNHNLENLVKKILKLYE